MNPAAVLRVALNTSDRALREEIFAAADSFMRGTFARDHRSNPLYRRLFLPDSDLLRTLFQQLPSCVAWLGIGRILTDLPDALQALLEVEQKGRSRANLSFSDAGDDTDNWTASRLLLPSFDPESAYGELEQIVRRDSGAREVLLVLSVLQTTFPGPPAPVQPTRARDSPAKASFLEIAQPALALPYPGTGPNTAVRLHGLTG
jgi:hypothetical protein